MIDVALIFVSAVLTIAVALSGAFYALSRALDRAEREQEAKHR